MIGQYIVRQTSTEHSAREYVQSIIERDPQIRVLRDTGTMFLVEAGECAIGRLMRVTQGWAVFPNATYALPDPRPRIGSGEQRLASERV